MDEENIDRYVPCLYCCSANYMVLERPITSLVPKLSIILVNNC